MEKASSTGLLGGGGLRGECGAKNKIQDSIHVYSPFYAYSNVEYVHVPIRYRVQQAEYVIHIRMAASQEYVNIYPTRRVGGLHRESRFVVCLCVWVCLCLSIILLF